MNEAENTGLEKSWTHGWEKGGYITSKGQFVRWNGLPHLVYLFLLFLLWVCDGMGWDGLVTHGPWEETLYDIYGNP